MPILSIAWLAKTFFNERFRFVWPKELVSRSRKVGVCELSIPLLKKHQSYIFKTPYTVSPKSSQFPRFHNSLPLTIPLLSPNTPLVI